MKGETGYEAARAHYLSGTGNSYRAAVWFCAQAASRGARSRALPMDRVREDEGGTSPDRFLLGLVFPTHGFTAPWHVIRFALGLPRGNGAHALVVATRAGLKFGRLFTPGLEGTATCLIALLLALKGYRVRGTLGLDMPSNWTSAHPGLSRAAAEAIIARGRAKAERFFGSILDGRTSFRGILSALLGIALVPVSLGYVFYGRFLFGKMFFATNRCTGCGLCARSCPTRSIRLLGTKRPRPYWTVACESCMRCMSFCPEGAVESGYSLAAVLIFVTSLPVPAYLAGRLGAGSQLLELLGYAYYLSALSLTYAVLHPLLRIRPLNALFAWTTPTKWYRRYREPETTIVKLRKGEAFLPDRDGTPQ